MENAMHFEENSHSTPLTVLERAIDLSRAAFIFMNYQISRLDMLPSDLAHDVLLATRDLRISLDSRQSRATVVHVVSLEQTIEFPLCMTPRQGEMVIAKHAKSAFHGTGLATHLKDKNINRIYICGISSLAEVVATALSAQDTFGHAMVIEDAYVETDEDGFAATVDLLANLDMLTDIKTIDTFKEMQAVTGGAVPEGKWKTNEDKWTAAEQAQAETKSPADARKRMSKGSVHCSTLAESIEAFQV